MRRIISISDTHGRKEWKEIVGREEAADVIIFEGDYFDSFDIPYAEQSANFQDILEFARKDPRIILLIGNHDFHYCSWARVAHEHYSGFQPRNASMINYDLSAALTEGLLKVAHSEGDVLFTHAGITKTFLERLEIENNGGLAQALNAGFDEEPMNFKFVLGERMDYSGDDPANGCLWVRPRSLDADKIEGWKQVVGHTRTLNIFEMDGIWFTDVLEGKNKQYLSIIDGVFKVETF